MAAENRGALVEDSRKVVECVIDCIKFLAAEMLAFWGSDSHEGKFMTLFKLMAKRDLRAAAYLQRIEQMRIKIKLVENQNLALKFEQKNMSSRFASILLKRQ